MIKEVATTMETELGPMDLSTLAAKFNLAKMLAEIDGQHDEAIAMLELVLSGRQSCQGPTHPDTLLTEEAIADLRDSIGHES